MIIDGKEIKVTYCKPGYAEGYTNDDYLPEEIDLNMDKTATDKEKKECI